MKKLLPLLLILSLLLTGCQVLDGDGMVNSSYLRVSQEEAMRLMAEEENYIILDVRTPEEYAEKHIKGAINVPNEEIDENEEIPQLPDKSQLILVYCRSGNRSKEAAQKLNNMGYENVVEFGGINTWKGETESSISEPENPPISEPDKAEEISLAIVAHSAVTEAQITVGDETMPLAFVSYPEVAVAAGGTEALKSSLSAFNDDMKNKAYSTLAQEYADAEEYGEDAWRYTSDSEERSLYVCRADGRVVSFSIMVEYFFNGPHPFTDYEAVNFDAQTGKILSISDVLNDEGLKFLVKNIYDNLEDVTDGYEYSEGEENDIKNRLQDMIESDSLCWTLTSTGIDFDFDAYDLMYYAFGPMFASLSYKDYADIFNPDYLPEEGYSPLGDRVTYGEGGTAVFTADDAAEYSSFD